MFIRFMGPDRSGKSTQIALLKERLLRDFQKESILTREPGGTPVSEEMWEMLRRLGDDMEPGTRILLRAASLCEHYDKVVEPATRRGGVVLSHMSIGPEALLDFVDELTGADSLIKNAAGIIESLKTPDLTVVIDIDPQKTGWRSAPEGEAASTGVTTGLGLTLQKKIREKYLAVAQQNPDKCLLLDGLQAKDTIAQVIFATVTQKMGLS